MNKLLANIEVGVTLSAKDAPSELVKILKGYQSEADKNTITYKIAGDKSSVEAMLKQIQGMKPELLTNVKLNFDKSYYEREIGSLKGYTGKTASEIGASFKQSIETSLSKFNVSDIIGKSLKKGDILEKTEIDKLRNSLIELKTQTKGFDIKNVTSVTEIENQVVALEKMNTILKTISEYSDRKMLKIDGSNMKIADMLSVNTSDINSVMGQVGDVIYKNASQWTTTLESAFTKEFGNIVNLINNLRNVINGVFDSGSGGEKVGANFDSLKTQIAQFEEQIKSAEAELEKLRELQKTFSGSSFRVKSQTEQKRQPIFNEISKIAGKATDIHKGLDTGNELNQFKSLVEEYMKFGGTLDSLPPKAKTLAESLKIHVSALNLDVITEQITNLESRIAGLNNEREKLLSQQQAVASGGTGAGSGSGTGSGGSGSGTPTTATVSPTLSGDFKQKLQEQVTAIGSVDATVSGKLSETFKSDLQTAVDATGKVDVGVKFSDAKNDGNKQEIPVDVTTTPKLSDSFKGDLQTLIDGTGKYEISIGAKEGDGKSVSIKATVENGEEFKNLLKQAVEGEGGLPVKVNPVIDKDLKLEIPNATLKDVKVEGSIQGGNLKPDSIEKPAGTPTAPASVGDGVANQDKLQGELEETKHKHEEVGQAAQNAAEVQKRSLLDVVKEYERYDKIRNKLVSMNNVASNTSNSEMKEFIKKKEEDAKKYVEANDLIAKIQSKIAEPTKSSARLMDVGKHYAGIVEYVNRLRELQGDKFSFKVLGENGKQEFIKMKELVDQLSMSSDELTEKIRKLNNKLNSLKTEKSGFEKTATEAEQLEVKIYGAVKALEKLKADKKTGLVDIDSKTFSKFFEDWEKYKSIGGKLGISDFTKESKVINAVSVKHSQELEEQARKEQQILEQRKQRIVEIKKSLQESYPKIDLNKYTDVFKQIEQRQIGVTEGFERIKAAEEALKASAAGIKTDPNKQEKPLGKGEVLVTPKVEDPAAFANKVTEQLKGQSATIDVKPNIVLDNTGDQAKKEGEKVTQTTIPIKVAADITALNTDIQSKKDKITPVDVKLTGNIESLNTNIQSKKDQILPVDVAIAVSEKTLKDLTTLSAELNKISGLITKIVEKPINVKADYSSIKGLYEIGKDGKNPLTKLKESIDGLQTGVLKDLGTSLSGLNVKANLANNITELSKALSNLKTSLNGIDPNSTGFLNTIKDLSSQAEGLKNLATVIRASKEEIQKAKDEINKSQGKAPDVVDKDKYTILKDTLNEVLRLTKEYNKERDSETKSGIASQIQLYKDRADSLQLELFDLEKINAVEQNRIDIIQDKIKLEENKQVNKELAAIEKQIVSSETLERQLNEQYEILAKDSNEWSHALELLSLYKSELQDVVKITRSINVDRTTGFQAISYQFTDSNGSTKTVGANSDLLMENTKVADLNDLYSKLKNSANEYYNLQEKILKGDTSSKTQTNSLIAYNNMLQAQKEIYYWKEKGLVPSKEQLQIEEKITSLAETYKEQDRKTGLLNMYKTVLNTVDRLNKKQEEVNNLKLKADGTTEFSESIKNAQDNVSTLIATLRGFKFSDFFSSDALSHFGLNGSSLLFNNNDLSSLKWVMSQLPLTEEQIQKINDALDKNTLVKEKNVAAQNKINDAEQKKNNAERLSQANTTYNAINNSLIKQHDLTKQIMQLEKDGRNEKAKLLNDQLVEEFRNCNNLISSYKSFNDVIGNVDANLDKLFSDSRQRFDLLGAEIKDTQNKDYRKYEKYVQDQLSKEYAQSEKQQKKTYSQFEKEQIQAAANAQKELNSLVDQYISKRNSGEMSTNAVRKAVLDHDSITLLDKIDQKINTVRNNGLLTEGQIKEALDRINKAEDELTKRLDVRNDAMFRVAETEEMRKRIDAAIKDSEQKEKDKIKASANAQKELNSLVDEYISKRSKAAMAKDPVNKSLYNHDSLIALDKIQQKIQSVKETGVLTESQIEESLNKIKSSTDELTNRLEIRNNAQKKVNAEKAKEAADKGVKSFNQKDQLELYNALSKAVQQYVYWLQKEQTATGSAKDSATALRQESESFMNSLRADIKSYGLQNLEKELDLDRQILEARRKINFQDEQAVANMAKSSYERELKLEERKAKLQMNNIGKDDAIIAKNNVRIKNLEDLIKKEQEYRQAMGLEEKAHEAAAQLINKKATLTNNLKVEQDAYNASVKAGNESTQKKLLSGTSGLTDKLSKAISTYTSADKSKLTEAQSLLGQLQAPSNNWNVTSSNVDSVVKKIQSDTDKIVNALKEQHNKITAQTKNNSKTSQNADKLEAAFKNVSIENANFSKVVKTNGDNSAVVQFIEQVGNKARTVTLDIKDMNIALSELANGKFNINSGNYKKTTGEFKEVVNVTSEVEKAYQGLMRTELQYQQLKAKVDTGTAKDSEKRTLEELITTRNSYNQKIQESTELTIREQQAKQKYNDKVAAVSAEYYDPYVSNASKNLVTYEANLARTKQLMDQVFKPDIAGFQSVFDRAQAEVDELNIKLLQGKIENVQTGYTDKINKKVSDLRKVVAVVPEGEDAQKMMRDYAESLNNGNVKVGNFTNSNKTLNASFKEQKGLIREVALQYNETTGAISLLDKGTNRVKSTFASFFDGLKGRFRALTQYLLTFASFYRIFGYIKQGANYIREFDKALTEMRKVSDETVSSLKNFQKVSFDIAKSVGTTAQQIQNSTADWMGEILVPLYGNI